MFQACLFHALPGWKGPSPSLAIGGLTKVAAGFWLEVAWDWGCAGAKLRTPRTARDITAAPAPILVP